MKVKNITDLQTVLITLGYDINDGISGILDVYTINALKLFQKDAGISQTGILDENTKRKLDFIIY